MANDENKPAGTTLGTMQRLFKMLKWYEASQAGSTAGLDNPLYTKIEDDYRYIAEITAEVGAGIYDVTEVSKDDGLTTLGTFAQSEIFNGASLRVAEANQKTGIAVGSIVEIFLRYDSDGEFQWFFIGVEPNGGTDVYIPPIDPNPTPYPDPVVTSPVIKGDDIWIQTVNQVVGNQRTKLVRHINAAAITSTHTIQAGDVIKFDATGHVLEIDGNSTIEDPPVVIIEDPYDVWTDDTPIQIEDGVVLTGLLEEVSTPPTEICEFVDYNFGLEIDKPLSTPFAGYEGLTWVIVGLVKETGEFIKFGTPASFANEIDDPVINYDTTKYGSPLTADLSEILLPPSAFDTTGYNIDVFYKVPSQALTGKLSFPVCALESQLFQEEGFPQDISITNGEIDTNWEWWIQFDDNSVFGSSVAELDARYSIDGEFYNQADNEMIAVTAGVTFEANVTTSNYFGATINLSTTLADFGLSAGDTICLKVYLFDNVFNRRIDGFEITYCRELSSTLNIITPDASDKKKYRGTGATIALGFTDARGHLEAEDPPTATSGDLATMQPYDGTSIFDLDRGYNEYDLTGMTNVEIDITRYSRATNGSEFNLDIRYTTTDPLGSIAGIDSWTNLSTIAIPATPDQTATVVTDVLTVDISAVPKSVVFIGLIFSDDTNNSTPNFGGSTVTNTLVSGDINELRAN